MLKQHSDRVWEYGIGTVMRGQGGALKSYGYESALALINADQQAQTLFYDVFRTLDGKEVVALQASEFASKFPGLQFSIGGRRAGVRSQSVHSVCMKSHQGHRWLHPREYLLNVWKVRIPRGMRRAPALPLEVQADGQRVALELPPSPFADWPRVQITQHTVQKEYPVEWVRDHCLFHHRANGYGRIVLYDNASADAYYAELVEMLAGLDEGLQVLLVRWPFRKRRKDLYGMKGGHVDGNDCKTQVAGYNHGLHLLRGRSAYATNLDLDEYLFNRTGKPLSKYMARKTRVLPCRNVYCEKVSNIADPRPEEPVRAVHFRCRLKGRGSDDGPAKFFYRFSGGWLKPLNFDHHVSVHRGIVPINIAMRAVNKLARILRLPEPFLKYFNPMLPVSKRELTIYHYDGILTDWRRPHHVAPEDFKSARPPIEYDPELHEPSEEMPSLLRRIGLGDGTRGGEK